MEVEVLHEMPRGCGFRRSGPDGVGIYLIGGAGFVTCERLPYPIQTCPTCGSGLKFSRGFTWFNPQELLDGPPLCRCAELSNSQERRHTGFCAMCDPPDNRQGLMWVGEKYYPSPERFNDEARLMGISKRIASIPRGFKLGQTWVYLAHIRGYCHIDGNGSTTLSAGIFVVFRPFGVDLVIDQTDSIPDRAKSIKRQIPEARLVKVNPIENLPLPIM